MSDSDPIYFKKTHIFTQEHSDSYATYKTGFNPDGKYWTVFIGGRDTLSNWMHAWNAIDILGHVELGESKHLMGTMSYGANQHADGNEVV